MSNYSLVHPLEMAGHSYFEKDGEVVAFEKMVELANQNEKLKVALRKLATESDMYFNDEGDAMDLADAITEAERLSQIEAI